ncbi:hypothetical protein CAP51_02285 [Acinetobacter populi]|jgi:hypothetical protein|uniref:Uncharacterized protein n=2 Tax=Acinetobacter populi TaxID=1582270 RepID=A0A1Z9Z1V9_9GAMM|nr:hypothetical protein CAP51_02285 [Acinetobacter populi]
MIEGHPMRKDDLNDKIIDALNQKADNLNKRHAVISGVFARIEEKRHQKYNRWGVGLAFAAAITGLSIVPSTLMPNHDDQPKMVVNTPKLTPQLADDLEMLLVLGEDIPHGS